jgi:muramoyltetrapeptide carboxypeptidase
MMDRRTLLISSVFAALASSAAAGPIGPFGPQKRRPVIKPKRLQPGDTVGLIAPSGVVWEPTDIDAMLEAVTALGLQPKLGKHVMDRYGYLGGSDEARAADLNAMFKDKEVDAIHCIRGGWGAARILPMIDFDAIAKNPKALIGFSDITALLLSIHARTGLVTFHGPTGIQGWNSFNVEAMRAILWNGQTPTLTNKPDTNSLGVQRSASRTRTITPGKARGRLMGGNLTVLTAILGSSYIPDFTDSILFLEDVQEAPYRVDRMITQLALNGILSKVRGVVWGTCSKCDPGEGFGSLTIPDVLNDHLKALGVPAYYGAMFGHIPEQFTLPVGVEAEIDADAGALRLLEPGVI